MRAPPSTTLFPYTTLFRSDPVYFRFSERLHHERPQIIFVGSLSYLPNHQAALRLVQRIMPLVRQRFPSAQDRKSTRLNSSHLVSSYAVFCLKKKRHVGARL